MTPGVDLLQIMCRNNLRHNVIQKLLRTHSFIRMSIMLLCLCVMVAHIFCLPGPISYASWVLHNIYTPGNRSHIPGKLYVCIIPVQITHIKERFIYYAMSRYPSTLAKAL